MKEWAVTSNICHKTPSVDNLFINIDTSQILFSLITPIWIGVLIPIEGSLSPEIDLYWSSLDCFSHRSSFHTFSDEIHLCILDAVLFSPVPRLFSSYTGTFYVPFLRFSARSLGLISSCLFPVSTLGPRRWLIDTLTSFE